MSELDKLLEEYASRATPSPPGNLEEAVWREIRLRRETSSRISLLDRLVVCLWHKHLAYASAVAAVALGVGLAWFGLDANAQATSDALNLQVFSDRSPTLRLARPLSESVKSSARLLLFVVLFAAIAACAFHFSGYFLRRSAAGPVNYHYWIHSQLGLNAKQENELEPIEAKFAQRRDELVVLIREANRELAQALLADKRDSDRVRTAVQKIHRAQGELQQAVLDHVFEMRPILTSEQYDRLISLTSHALRESPEPR